jgi:glycolate oxidase FAD binding subunit
VASAAHVLPHGGRSKPRLSTSHHPAITPIDLTALEGIVAYEPGEFVFSAMAGTPLADIETALDAQGQFLPFDPPLASAGATLGGTVAAGLSGPGRQRYGGIRDFIIAARFVDAEGRQLNTGGKVVKNAAGFDFPKMFVGSLGRLGILYELTFKVFPAPDSYLTLNFELGHIEQAIASAHQLAALPFDAFAIDITPPGNLRVRLGGERSACESTARRIEELIAFPCARQWGESEPARWQAARSFDWATNELLIKIPCTPHSLSDLDVALGRIDAHRRYSAAGNVAHVSIDLEHITTIETELQKLGLAGLVLRGDAPKARIGTNPAASAEALLKRALDPDEKFLPLP